MKRRRAMTIGLVVLAMLLMAQIPTRRAVVLYSNSAIVSTANPLPVSEAGGSFTVDQATHDNLNMNANVQVGDVDVSTTHGMPVHIVPADTGCTEESINAQNAGASIVVDQTAGGVVVAAASTSRCKLEICNIDDVYSVRCCGVSGTNTCVPSSTVGHLVEASTCWRTVSQQQFACYAVTSAVSLEVTELVKP